MTERLPKIRLRHWMIAIALLFILTLPLVYSAIVVPLSPAQQALVSLALLAFAIAASVSRLMRPLIIFLSCFASMRYFYWRISSTLNLETEFDAVISVLLLGAEIYGLVILFLGYFQTIEVLKRTSPPLQSVPSVDILIPTYNESAGIVRRTAIGALAIDYPNKKVFVLDDGRRPEIQAMAESLGCEYLTRADNRHAKAGNLNEALKQTSGELVAIFDADHVPVRSFLKKTVGFFEDSKVALVQTAQHFFNPDPYERNLHLTGRVAPEQSFFYHVIQPGNDFWNAAFFCGSCAVLRRSALESIGGIKTQTVTEDAHTALELHSRGLLSVYLPLPLAAGLATETFAAHVKQRIRWARGMAQILRIDCPLFKSGLSLPQRLNYFNAMLHFFFGIPRLIMILAPLTFLLLGAHPIKANALAVIAYILPHIGLSTIANSIISKSFRQSFWAGVYEVSIAPYTAGVTLMAMLNPKLGKFNVTDKGTNLDEAYFDLQTSWVTLSLIALSVLGLMVAFPVRLLLFGLHGSDPTELHSILINTPWALANLMTLIAAACVAYEQPQQREMPRVEREYGCLLEFAGQAVICRTLDISESGVAVSLDRPLAITPEVDLTLWDAPEPWQAESARSAEPASGVSENLRLRAKLVRCDWNASGQVVAAFSFLNLEGAKHRALVQLIFCGDNSWTRHRYPQDQVVRSFWYLLTTFWRVTKPRQARSRRSPRISGRWKGWLDGREITCHVLSAHGASIESASSLSEEAEAGVLLLEFQPGIRLQMQVSRRRSLNDSLKLFSLEFRWDSFDAQASVGEKIYDGNKAPQSSPIRHPVLKWLQELR
jgi:cellulose synthase (UDP-forming)